MPIQANAIHVPIMPLIFLVKKSLTVSILFHVTIGQRSDAGDGAEEGIESGMERASVNYSDGTKVQGWKSVGNAQKRSHGAKVHIYYR